MSKLTEIKRLIENIERLEKRAGEINQKGPLTIEINTKGNLPTRTEIKGQEAEDLRHIYTEQLLSERDKTLNTLREVYGIDATA